MRLKNSLIGDYMQDSLIAILTDAISCLRYAGYIDAANTLEQRMNNLMGWRK